MGMVGGKYPRCIGKHVNAASSNCSRESLLANYGAGSAFDVADWLTWSRDTEESIICGGQVPNRQHGLTIDLFIDIANINYILVCYQN